MQDWAYCFLLYELQSIFFWYQNGSFFADKCAYICLVKVLIVIITGKALVSFQKLHR